MDQDNSNGELVMGEEDKEFDKKLERASKAIGAFKQLGDIFGIGNKKEDLLINSSDYSLLLDLKANQLKIIEKLNEILEKML